MINELLGRPAGETAVAHLPAGRFTAQGFPFHLYAAALRQGGNDFLILIEFGLSEINGQAETGSQ